jgi:hypothetical protein
MTAFELVPQQVFAALLVLLALHRRLLLHLVFPASLGFASKTTTAPASYPLLTPAMS